MIFSNVEMDNLKWVTFDGYERTGEKQCTKESKSSSQSEETERETIAML